MKNPKKLKKEDQTIQFGPRFNKVDIPYDWDAQPLSNISKIVVGHVGSTSEYYQKSGIVFLRTLNVKENFLDTSDIKFVAKDFHQKLKKSQVNSGDILISRVGNAGKACVVPENFPEANCANVLILRTENVNPHFLCFVLNSNLVQKQITSMEAGSVQKVINAQTFDGIVVPFPKDPCETDNIVSVIKNVELLVQKTQEMIDQTINFKIF